MTTSTDIRFIILFPNISQEQDFILKDLPGSGKRIDILCRSLATVFDWAPQLSDRFLTVDAILSDSILHFTHPKECTGRSETWWAAHIKSALKGTPPEFIEMKPDSLGSYIELLLKRERIIVLHEDGEPLESVLKERVPQYSFMLGNHQGFDEKAEKVIRKMELPLASLGTQRYLGSHCMAAIISHFEANER